MAWNQQGGAGGAAGGGGFGPPLPPPPPVPPAPPPHPPRQPPPPAAPADPLRAAAVALLNLSGLGLGYALMRRWIPLAACLAATTALLVIVLPADPDGVPAGLLAGYLALLALAAAHGAFLGLRTGLLWPPRAPLALALGLVLLAAPAGGAVLYDKARDDAVQRMLLDRLDAADRLVEQARGKPFGTVEARYRAALKAYDDLRDDHPGSQAAARVPARLKTYYTTIGAPYEDKKYCDAIQPLKFLRTVPGTVGKKALGSLVTWPDDRLATSLYECGMAEFIAAEEVTTPGKLRELLTAFPASEQAAQVEPAIEAVIDETAGKTGGDDPCSATERLRTYGGQVEELAGAGTGDGAALRRIAGTADRSVRSGTYACGVDQYRDGDFDAALTTMNDFADTYRDDRDRARAQKIAIAAEIAKDEPEAGERLPTTASGGSISVTVKNDSPDEIRILYTGPVTGSFTLKACDGCTVYDDHVSAGDSACRDGRRYPQKTLHLPPGTTYFLQKSLNGAHTTPGTHKAKIRSGYVYTECAYSVQDFGLDS